MKKTFLLLLAICAISCETSQKVLTSEDSFAVFRSVLDGQPRIATALLGDGHYAAYDTQEGILFKAWHGSVALEGAVYTTVHGPQPESVGHAYFEKGDDSWLLKQGDQMTQPTIQYQGHSIIKGVPSFNWNMISPDGQIITLSESPHGISESERPKLERTFSLNNPTDYDVILSTSLGYISDVSDVTTDGTLAIEDVQLENIGEVSVSMALASLSLNNGKTTLTTTYHPEYDQIKLTAEDEMAAQLSAGAALIDGSDCRACHNEEAKTVGPAYLTIAKKYNDDDESIDLLAHRIIKGGNGVWGEAIMTPHADLPMADAQEMVRYVLSLDDDISAPESKYGLGVKSVPVNLSDQYDGDDGAGFFAHLYYNPDGMDFLEATEELEPVMQGVVSRIHTLEDRDFKNLRTDFVIEYEGKINIPKDGSYDFRLISDDGSYLFLNGDLIIDNGGYHGPEVKDGEMYLKAGDHDIRVILGQGGGGAMISFQWFDKESESFVLIDQDNISFSKSDIKKTSELKLENAKPQHKPGDKAAVAGLHPSFDLYEARPAAFKPRVGGIDFLDDGRMVVCTWDSIGGVYLVDNWQSGDPSQMTHRLIGGGLAEPLGLKVVDNEIYILQKQELTKLIDLDGDDWIDEYKTISAAWRVSANFHEFAFGLVYQDGYFYGALATAILPGGASANPQISDRGKVVKINKETGATELIAYGLRTPNGIGIGIDHQIFVADNQGDWLPASKIVHIKEGAFYGSRSVDFEGTEGVEEMLPVAWLPQDEIGNSPSTPLIMKAGPYAGQMIHGEVTNGGIKRVFVEEVEGQYQGALFRFSQGFGAGINRIIWAPDGSLMTGGVGSTGNWNHMGKGWYSLQRMVYNDKTAFEMLSVSAKEDGFEITFTEPVGSNHNITAADFEVEQWRYEPTKEYGGPKLDQETLDINRISVSADRKKVSLQLTGMKEKHMVYIRIASPIKSESGNGLWTTETWYTLNKVPEEAIKI